MPLLEFPEVVNFKRLFRERGTKEHPYPTQISYNNKTICLSDELPIKNKEKLIFSIEKTNSRYPQGFCISIFDGYIKANGESLSGRRKYTKYRFWEDSEVLDIKNIEIQIFTKMDHIFIQNIWEINIYEEDRFDITGKPKVVRFPEGKPTACFVGGDQWAMGRGNGAAMYSEDIPNGKRYFCNDGDEDDDFDDIVFTVTRVLS